MHLCRYGIIKNNKFISSTLTQMKFHALAKFFEDYSKIKAFDDIFDQLYINALKAGKYVIAFDVDNNMLYGWIPNQKEQTLEKHKFA